MIKFSAFSPKQMAALTWWCNGSGVEKKNGIICDGAVRSGKTLCLCISFVAWSFYSFSNTSFAMCGKTIASLRRNVVTPILPVLKSLGFDVKENLSRNFVDISKDNRSNRFYLFGGRDESSAALIQGMTLGGVLFDEVALMPRSFVEQALARCSLENSKFFFNCNPEYPHHWFNEEWIKKKDDKNVLYVHFRMEDNPSLTPEIIERYKSLYSGAFYERFVEGKWVAAQGLVYPMFDVNHHIRECEHEQEYFLSCDYGTLNPFSLGLWARCKNTYYRIDEYYHDAREQGIQLTDEEYYVQLEKLVGSRKITALVIDPSAASFIQCVRKKGKFKVVRANNDVINGINRVCDALKNDEIFFSRRCRDSIREFSMYRWDDRAKRDAVRKEHDHAMDDIRYFVMYALGTRNDDCFSFAIERK